MHCQKLRIAVFASGKGSNFQAIVEEIAAGNINGEIILLISDNPNSEALERAKLFNIETYIIDMNIPKDDQIRNLLDVLLSSETNLIVLAGYLKLLPIEITRVFKNQIINIHPALIPSFCGKGFYGMKVHKAVIDAGVRITGVTVHLVDEIYDNGRIIFQAPLFVTSYETPEQLADKIHIVEHLILPRIIEGFSKGFINVQQDRIFIKREFEQDIILDLARICIESI